MKTLRQKIVPLAMILLAIIPALVIYEGLSQALPSLPNFKAPGWFIPVGFINIGLIVILAFTIKGNDE
jgi:hypothetical protein